MGTLCCGDYGHRSSQSITETRKVPPFFPQLDTSDLVIGVSLDELVDGITAAATGLPAPAMQTVVPKAHEKPAQVVALRPRRDEGTEGGLLEE